MLEPLQAPAQNYVTHGAVLDVHDGDTITVLRDLGHDVLYRTNFRLLGLDTPEINKKDQKPYGVRARQHLIDLISRTTLWWDIKTPWGQVRLPKLVMRSVEPDKFGGRWLAEIWLPDGAQQLQFEMIADRYARPYSGDAKQPWDFRGYPER